MHSKPLVYLAGPMAGLSHDAASRWRRIATNELAPNIATCSPLRGKEELVKDGPFTTAQYEAPVGTDQAILGRDHYDVQRCDAVLMNLEQSPRISIGSMIEIGWATAYRKPLILVTRAVDDPYDHPIVRAAALYRVHSLAEALRLLKMLLTPETDMVGQTVNVPKGEPNIGPSKATDQTPPFAADAQVHVYDPLCQRWAHLLHHDHLGGPYLAWTADRSRATFWGLGRALDSFGPQHGTFWFYHNDRRVNIVMARKGDAHHLAITPHVPSEAVATQENRQ